MAFHAHDELFFLAFTNIHLSSIFENDVSATTGDIFFHEFQVYEVFAMNSYKGEVGKKSFKIIKGLGGDNTLSILNKKGGIAAIGLTSNNICNFVHVKSIH